MCSHYNIPESVQEQVSTVQDKLWLHGVSLVLVVQLGVKALINNAI